LFIQPGFQHIIRPCGTDHVKNAPEF